jgi:predicted phosphodiesterase
MSKSRKRTAAGKTSEQVRTMMHNWRSADQHAAAARVHRAEIKAYEADLFADAPEKRHRVTAAKTVAILSDLQIPFEDGAAVNQALEVLRAVNPDTVILNGDILDCYLESSFSKRKPPAVLAQIAGQTFDRAQRLMESLQDIPVKLWNGGNHEARWEKQIAKENERGGLSPITLALVAARGKDIDFGDMSGSFARVNNLHGFGFKYIPYSDRWYLAEDNLVVTHGKYVSRHSGQAAKRTFEWLGRSCIVGHTHRQGNYRLTQDGREHGAWEGGCLCQLEPEYDDAPNWQQGLTVVKINGPEFHVVEVPIVRRGSKPVAIYQGLEAAL